MELIKRETKGMIFFLSEAIQVFLIYIFSIAAVWLWLPYNQGIKLILIILIILNFYSVEKNFIYLRYSLWKESL